MGQRRANAPQKAWVIYDNIKKYLAKDESLVHTVLQENMLSIRIFLTKDKKQEKS